MTIIDPQLVSSQLDLLYNIIPPDTIIHAGAGHGVGCAQQWLKWQPQHAVIIDADASRLGWAKQQLSIHQGWGVGEAVLGREAGEADYHTASNRNEDGLISPESLTSIWPNLRTIETVRKSVRRLDTLLHTEYRGNLKDSHSIWTIIESLAALPILQGAGQELDRWSVIWVRVLLSTASQPELDDATLEAVEAYLSRHGFACALVIEGNHPSIGDAIFVRDWRHLLSNQLSDRKTQLDQSVKVRDEQTKLAAERLEQNEQLTKARDEQAKLAAERQSQLEQQKKELDEQTKLATERKTQLDQAVKARDEQTKLAAERLEQNEQLTKVRDEQAKLAAERLAENNKLKTSLQESDSRRNKLESQIAEYEHRQQLMNEEMIRAEGQINLIKDLLLREPGL